MARFAISAVRLIATALALMIAHGVAAPASAQDDGFGATFITPFPAGDVYSLAVIGDDLADGVMYGLQEALQGDTRIQMQPKRLSINGLMRADFASKLQGIEEDLKATPAHIAVVMLGAWDRVSVRTAAGRRAAVGSDEWRLEYGQRADRLMKTLKRRNVAVYWIGFPIVRRYDDNEEVQVMNNILREKAYLNGMKYIDTYAGFIDETGGFSAHGPDITGRIRLLRSGDGVYFTSAGYRKVAHFVERDLKRDLTQAKADRSIPLAGSEGEQAKINPDREKGNGPAQPGANSAGAAAAGASPVAGGAEAASTAGPSNGDQPADNGKISLRMVNQSGAEETITLDIVRPSIPASVVALVTRRERADRPAQMGEALIDEIPGGLSVMNTVAVASTAGPGGGRRPLSPAQSPYFRVLFKGERLPPKPGRADDLTWPRPEPPPPTPAAAAEPPADGIETGATEDGAAEEAPVQKRRRRRD